MTCDFCPGDKKEVRPLKLVGRAARGYPITADDALRLRRIAEAGLESLSGAPAHLVLCHAHGRERLARGTARGASERENNREQ
jgi:hypothetical protein